MGRIDFHVQTAANSHILAKFPRSSRTLVVTGGVLAFVLESPSLVTTGPVHTWPLSEGPSNAKKNEVSIYLT